MADAVADPVTPAAEPTTPAADAGAPTGAPVVVSDPVAPPPSEPEKPAAVAPEKYELKLPEVASLDAASVERTAAFARERGLTNDAAQAALDLANTEVASAVAKSREDFIASYQPGDPEHGIAPGAEWQKQHDAWLAASLAAPDLGNGNQDALNAKVALAGTAFEKFASQEFRALLSRTGYGSHPEMVRTFAKIGEAMSEKGLVLAGTQTAAEKTALDLYPSMAKS